jgi:uncharacterized protein
MSLLSGLVDLPEDFDGKVRLFPLPGLVLFPHAMQPLHIFEPRYVDMLSESLAGDQLIAMATLEDPDAIAFGAPSPIAKTVCVGRIVSHSRVEHDRHNILLVGIRRGEIRRELDANRPFRVAQIDLIDDFYLPAGTAARADLKKRLLQSFGKLVPSNNETKKNLHDLMAGSMGVGPITDIIAFTLPLPVPAKLRLLATADVDARAESLISLMNSGSIHLNASSDAPPARDRFPPPFSLN